MECRIRLQVHPLLPVNGNRSLEEVSWQRKLLQSLPQCSFGRDCPSYYNGI
uniref:Uncharacterized protein n=1 Tax=Arundo donax TaxID=35708 RepID=A0A0A9CLK7_ARUDO